MRERPRRTLRDAEGSWLGLRRSLIALALPSDLKYALLADCPFDAPCSSLDPISSQINI